MPNNSSPDYERRFGGLQRLYGLDVLARLAQAHVMVAGIGGVGSWCAEALARSGVGALTLIDMDHVAESNINRQLHALSATLGQAKVQAMKDRIGMINAHCRVRVIDDFVSPDNVAACMAGGLHVVIDATDQVAAKIAMILEGHRQGIPVVVCGGAGGKTDPLALRGGDLSLATHDALLNRVRSELRRRHGYPKAAPAGGRHKQRAPRMKVQALWFAQPAILPEQWKTAQEDAYVDGLHTSGRVEVDAPVSPAALQGLSCAGYGSVVTVTATLGMAAANQALILLTQAA